MLKTRSGLPKFCSRTLDRKGGKWRIRFRRHGFSTYLPGAPWSETYMRAYADALNGTKAQASNIATARTVAGTVNALVVAYLDPQSNTTFNLGADATQRTRR